jgi:membrane fusion protein, multidrug efflux system
MRPRIRNLIYILSLSAILLIVVFWWTHKPEKPEAEKGGEAKGQVAMVRTALIREGALNENIAAYGMVLPAPGASQTVSVSFESQIVRVMVSTSQKVSPGNDLLELKPSPETALALEQAREAYDISQLSLQHMERRFELKLATNEQVLQARQTMEQAQLKLESMKKRGIGPARVIHADTAGLIKNVRVQEGAIVAAGNPLVEIVAKNRLEVRLGVEPEDLDRVKENQAVLMTRVNVPALPSFTGYVRKISYGVNPATRLVDVFVSLAAPADLLLDDAISGKIITAETHGLIVPRSAVLPAGRGSSLFTIKQGRAVQHQVRLGIHNDKEAEVKDATLVVGDKVVFLGNYELRDGMAVKEEVAP